LSGTESLYTEHRAPQRNDDNISSKEVASASASDGLSASLCAMSDMAIDPIPTDNAREPGYDPAHIPPSNTDTAGTDETLVGANTTTTAPTPIPHPVAYQKLTQFSLAFHQHELTQRWTDNVDGWIAGAGMGDRLRNMSYGGYDNSAGCSMDSVAGGLGRSGASSVAAAAVTGRDWHVVPLAMAAAAADADVVLAGAWTSDAAAGHRRWSVVSVEEEY
jgi:hypothetical protein